MKKLIVYILLALLSVSIYAQSTSRSIALVLPSGNIEFSGKARKEILKAVRKNKLVTIKDYKAKNAAVSLLENHDAVVLIVANNDLKAENIIALMAEGKKTPGRILVWNIDKKTPLKTENDPKVDTITSATAKKAAKPIVKSRIIPFILGEDS